MKLKDLKDIIAEDTPVSIAFVNEDELPFMFNTFKELKEDIKENGWGLKVKELRSSGSILIILDDEEE